MTNELKRYIELNIDKIDNKQFDTLYEDCPTNLRGELTTTLYIADIDILSELTKIYHYMFHNVDCVEEVIIPESIKIIEDYAFFGCSSITRVTLPEGIVQLPAHSFSFCPKLSYVVLPTTIKEIGESCFGYTDLEYIHYRGTVKQFKQTGLHTKVRWKKFSPLNYTSGRIQCIDGVI